MTEPSSQLKLISTGDVLAGKPAQRSVALETAFGNGDLIKALELLGIAGPFTATSPWELRDAEGRHLISAGGYAAVPFGEMYPPLVKFIHRYLEQNHSLGLPQQSASDWRAALESNLIALLARAAPSHRDSQVFFSNSGAEAIEAALKFARAARPGAKRLINFSRAYHGKTAGALSLTPVDEYQAPFRPLLPGVVTLPYGSAEALVRAVKKLGPDSVTAIVLEPIQGEGGVIVPPADFLPVVNILGKEHGILTIADEIQTGLGRSGHWFASLAGGLEPDIITLAKPLGGGMVPIGATLARQWIVKKMLGGLASKRHSSTFGGGSLAMAVGLKSLELLVNENLVERSRQLGEVGLARLKEIQAGYPAFLKEVRGAGMLFALQLQPLVNPKLLPGQAELVSQLGSGLALRTLHLAGVHACYTLNSSQTVRLTPALNMPEDLFMEMFNRVEHAARTHRKAWRMLPRTPLAKLLGLAKLAFRP
jgi:ornithine--oxo-acid transaminase/putrescine aminotransferase